jgi:heparan-alpha-glucosaminide N-acetyltransferase
LSRKKHKLYYIYILEPLAYAKGFFAYRPSSQNEHFDIYSLKLSGNYYLSHTDCSNVKRLIRITMKQFPKRLLSIDVLRALTMLLMIFVNDASGIDKLPIWLDHAKEYEDALGFADTIFPAFLFIAGLSIPLALKSRISKGDTTKQLIYYILIRSAALLIMGFYHVNMEDYNMTHSLLPRALWEIIITIAFFIIWLDYPDTLAKTKKYILQGTGIILLIAMAIVFRGGNKDYITWMKPSWWGILGIIGWSYLLSALIYVFSKGRLGILILFWVIIAGLNIFFHTLSDDTIPILGIGDASSLALMMGGVVIISLYSYLVKIEKTQFLWLIFTAIGVGLIALGIFLRPYSEGISKIRSTPAWVLICSGITVLMFEFFIYLIDIKGKANWFKIIRPAGTSTLTCYLIPYLQMGIIELLHINYPDIFNTGLIGALRSLATGLIIIWLVGLMEKRHLRLKI